MGIFAQSYSLSSTLQKSAPAEIDSEADRPERVVEGLQRNIEGSCKGIDGKTRAVATNYTKLP